MLIRQPRLSSPTRTSRLLHIMLLLCYIMLTSAATTQAGELVSAEHGFRMVWADRWKRVTQGESDNVPLFLLTEKETEALTIIIHPDIPVAEPFLKEAKVPQMFIESVSGKELLGDSVTKVDAVPARRMVFRQMDDGIAVFTVVPARGKGYMLIGTFKGMKQAQAERSYDALLKGLRLEAPAASNPPKTTTTTTTTNNTTPARPASTSSDDDFGSDF